jgi:hypothetical protein
VTDQDDRCFLASFVIGSSHLRLLEDDDVVHLLRAAVKREGSQAAFAKRYGLDRFTLNSVLNGKRRVNATVLKAFGLRKVYVTKINSANDDPRTLSISYEIVEGS